MPIYEFECKSCGKVSEFILKISDAYPTKCNDCGSENALQKIMSATNFHLKGGGWYSEGYDSKSNKAGSDKSSKPSSEPASTNTSATTASDSAPAKPAASTAKSDK